MTEIFWTPDAADENGPPSNGSFAGDDLSTTFDNIVVQLDGDSVPYLLVEDTTTPDDVSSRLFRILSLNGTTIPDAADVEMYFDIATETGSTGDARVVGRADTGQLPTLDAYSCGINTPNNGLRHTEYVDGTFNELGNASVSQTERRAQRVRFNTNTQQSVIWNDGDPEPANWQLDTTSSAISQAGAVGIHKRNSSSIGNYLRIYAIGFADGGGTAPKTESTGDTTAPTVSSAATDVAGDTVTVTFNEALDTANDTASGEWTINVNGSAVTINSAAIDTGSTTDVVIELASAVAGGDTVTADYSGTTLRDDAGNQVATFTDQAVTNNVADPTVTLDGNNALYTGGLVAASVTDIEVWVIEKSGHTVEHHETGLATDASGVLSITLTGSSLTSGADVLVAGQKADGRRFVADVTVD